VWGFTDCKYFQEILNLAILGVNAGDNSLKIWKALRHIQEVRLKSWVVHEILNSIQSFQLMLVLNYSEKLLASIPT
jgi:hypothetical protein